MGGFSKSAIRLAPVHECLRATELEKDGIGYVVIARRLPEGLVSASVFLVDVFCLGVKNAFLQVFSDHEYAEIKTQFSGKMALRTCTAPHARKLLEGAVAYARQLGFEPCGDYYKAAVIFGDIDPTECADTFVFGKDGKPCYVRGPSEDPIRANRTVEQLRRRCGPDGFTFIIGGPEDELDETGLFDDDLDDDGDDEEEPDEVDAITDEILNAEPPPPASGSAPPASAEEKPKGFFRRLFGK